MINDNVKSGFIWKLLERFGVLGTQFVLQIILARILSPEDYGALSIMVIFTSLANVFIQNGFNTALIQRKDVTEEDYSTVFWITMVIATILYVVIYLTAPYIGHFYNMPYITNPLRVIALILFPGALNSIQLAKLSRKLDFKKVFLCNLAGGLISGVVSIIVAIRGGGLWALVIQSLLNVIVVCIVMKITVRYKIFFICNLQRAKALFSYGWKLLVSGLLDTLFQDLRSLVIGKKYDTATLGYYNKGKQFPQFIINAINGAVNGVMLPFLASNQDDKKQIKEYMRLSVKMSSYMVFPIMGGLAAVAPALISVLLTDKWLPCVPYMQIYCFNLAFYPIHSANLQAINAIGRSDIFLKLEVIKKSYSLLFLVIAVFCFDSPIAIAATGLITTIFSFFVNAGPNRKLINYTYREQIKDILPSLVCTIFMCVLVLLFSQLNLIPVLILLIQISIGILIYFLVSIVFKIEPYKIMLSIIFKNRKKND